MSKKEKSINKKDKLENNREKKSYVESDLEGKVWRINGEAEDQKDEDSD